MNYDQAEINQAVAARAARYCITGTIRRGEKTYTYASTSEIAEQIRKSYEEDWHYYAVRIHPPVEDMDVAAELARLGEQRATLKRQERETTEQLKATVLRAAERDFAEADIARRANIDRMTVRTWLGKQ